MLLNVPIHNTLLSNMQYGTSGLILGCKMRRLEVKLKWVLAIDRWFICLSEGTLDICSIEAAFPAQFFFFSISFPLQSLQCKRTIRIKSVICFSASSIVANQMNPLIKATSTFVSSFYSKKTFEPTRRGLAVDLGFAFSSICLGSLAVDFDQFHLTVWRSVKRKDLRFICEARNVKLTGSRSMHDGWQRAKTDIWKDNEKETYKIRSDLGGITPGKPLSNSKK